MAQAQQPTMFDRDQLAELTQTAEAQLVFGFKDSPTAWQFRRVPLYNDLQEEFRGRAENAAGDLAENRDEYDYDPEAELPDDGFYFVPNEPPVGGNFFTDLPNFASMREYQPKKRHRSPNVWVIVAQLDDQSTAFFGARITASSVLARNDKLLRIVGRDNAFDSLDEEVISLKPTLDWIAWKRALAVLDSPNFHRVFRDIPALIALVDDHLTEITRHVEIVNLDEWAARIKTTPSMVVKLSRIIARADMHVQPPDVLREYGEEYDIEVEWDGDAMIFDGDVRHQWNILRLLDEARTLGPVTGKKWDSSAKIEV